MPILVRSLMAGCFLLAAPAVVAAGVAGTALASDISVRVDLLRINTTMFFYDEENTAYVAQARRGLEELAPMLEACRLELAARDAGAAEALARDWQLLRDSLVGGGDFSGGLLDIGYDAAQHAYFADGAQQVQDRVGRACGPGGDYAGLGQRTVLQMSRALSGYIVASASPFGSYTNSFNSGDEGDVTVMASRLDGLLAELEKQYRGNAQPHAVITRTQVKWRFIRSALLQVGQKSMPTIVYLHGNDILRDLQALDRPPAP